MIKRGNHRHAKQGMSLSEIALSVAICGILMAILIPIFLHGNSKPRIDDAKLNNSLSALQTALSATSSEVGLIPRSMGPKSIFKSKLLSRNFEDSVASNKVPAACQAGSNNHLAENASRAKNPDGSYMYIPNTWYAQVVHACVAVSEDPNEKAVKILTINRNGYVAANIDAPGYTPVPTDVFNPGGLTPTAAPPTIAPPVITLRPITLTPTPIVDPPLNGSVIVNVKDTCNIAMDNVTATVTGGGRSVSLPWTGPGAPTLPIGKYQTDEVFPYGTSVSITTRKPGYANSTDTSPPIYSRFISRTLTMLKYVPMPVHVVDYNGNPLAGAAVAGSYPAGGVINVPVTDSSGNTTLSVLEGSPAFNITVSKSGNNPAYKSEMVLVPALPLCARPVPTIPTVKLLKYLNLTVNVINRKTNAALSGVTAASNYAGINGSTINGSNTYVSILEGTSVTVTASKNQFTSLNNEGTATKMMVNTNQTMTLYLRPLYNLSIHVNTNCGHLANGASITGGITGTTDAAANAVFPNLPWNTAVGSYTIQRSPDLAPGSFSGFTITDNTSRIHSINCNTTALNVQVLSYNYPGGRVGVPGVTVSGTRTDGLGNFSQNTNGAGAISVLVYMNSPGFQINLSKPGYIGKSATVSNTGTTPNNMVVNDFLKNLRVIVNVTKNGGQAIGSAEINDTISNVQRTINSTFALGPYPEGTWIGVWSGKLHFVPPAGQNVQLLYNDQSVTFDLKEQFNLGVTASRSCDGRPARDGVVSGDVSGNLDGNGNGVLGYAITYGNSYNVIVSRPWNYDTFHNSMQNTGFVNGPKTLNFSVGCKTVDLQINPKNSRGEIIRNVDVNGSSINGGTWNLGTGRTDGWGIRRWGAYRDTAYNIEFRRQGLPTEYQGGWTLGAEPNGNPQVIERTFGNAHSVGLTGVGGGNMNWVGILNDPGHITGQLQNMANQVRNFFGGNLYNHGSGQNNVLSGNFFQNSTDVCLADSWGGAQRCMSYTEYLSRLSINGQSGTQAVQAWKSSATGNCANMTGNKQWYCRSYGPYSQAYCDTLRTPPGTDAACVQYQQGRQANLNAEPNAETWRAFEGFMLDQINNGWGLGQITDADGNIYDMHGTEFSPVKVFLKAVSARVNSDDHFQISLFGLKYKGSPIMTSGGLHRNEAWLVTDRSNNGFFKGNVVDGEDVFGDHVGTYKTGYQDLEHVYAKILKKDKDGKRYIELHTLSPLEKAEALTHKFNPEDPNPSMDLKLLTRYRKVLMAGDYLNRVYVDYHTVNEYDYAHRNFIKQRASVVYKDGDKVESGDQWFTPMLVGIKVKKGTILKPAMQTVKPIKKAGDKNPPGKSRAA